MKCSKDNVLHLCCLELVSLVWKKLRDMQISNLFIPDDTTLMTFFRSLIFFNYKFNGGRLEQTYKVGDIETNEPASYSTVSMTAAVAKEEE